MRNGAIAPTETGLEALVAKYELKRLDDGKWRVWARYTQFKGGAVKSHVAIVERAEIGRAVTEAHEWVAQQRRPTKKG